MTDDFIEKTIQLLENERDQLKLELVNKIEQRDKAIKTLSELFSVPFWKKPFIPFLEERVKRKSERFKRKIPALEEEIEHYEQAIVHLAQGIYSSAMSLLKRLAFIACLGSVRGTKCVEILELIEQLALRKGGEKEPL